MNRIKKLLAAIAIMTLLLLSFSGCKQYAPNEVLYVYNWGEYMDETVNDLFEHLHVRKNKFGVDYFNVT